MKRIGNSDAALSIRVVQVFLFGSVSVLAALTIVVHFAQLIGIRFRVLSLLALVLVPLVLGAVAWEASRLPAQIQDRDTGILFLILLLSIVGALLGLASHKPDADDYYYVPNAVYYLEHPDDPLGFDIHFVDAGPQPFTSHAWGTSVAYDYVRAITAQVLGVEYLFVYYVLSVAFVGSVIPLAAFYLTSQFTSNTLSAAIGTAAGIVILLLLGETHRTFGNFAFNRAFQGKVFLLAVGIPLFAAATIDFFKTRSRIFWLFLVAILIAMVGSTASAIVLLPALSVPLVLATLGNLHSQVERKRLLLIIAEYAATFFYLGLYAGFLLLTSRTELGSNSPINQSWPTSFLGHLRFLTDPAKPTTIFILLSATSVSLWLRRGSTRRFLAIWLVSVCVLYLNPIVAPVFIEYVTTPNLYWRMFYLLPFPLTANVATAAIFEHVGRFIPSAKTRLVGIAIALLPLILLNWTPFSTSVFQTTTRFAWPTYKLPAQPLAVARQVAEIAPAGVMLAPPDISPIIPMVSSNHPQIRMREAGVRLWWSSRGMAHEAERRIAASAFVGGESQSYGEFRRLLEEDVIRSIVLKQELCSQVQELLATQGFVRKEVVGEYVIVWK